MFVVHKLKRGEWCSCRLRITAFAVERLDSAGNCEGTDAFSAKTSLKILTGFQYS